MPKSVLNKVKHLPNEFQKRIFKMASIAYSSTVQDHSSFIEKCSKETNLSKQHIYDILGAYIALMKFYLENTESDFNQKLLEYGFTTNFSEKLPTFSSRNEVFEYLMYNGNTNFGKISVIKWRIDISLSNSALIKKVPMNLLMSFTMENGKKLKITVEPREFHTLRFNIALILKEINTLKLRK